MNYSSTECALLRSIAKQRLSTGLRRVLVAFEATPDERLDFKPSETANSPRELMRHLIDGNGYVSGCFGIQAAATETASERDLIVAQLSETTQAILDRIEGLSDDEVNSSVDFFGHPMPMADFMMVSEWHFTRHAGQLDYVQTIYGDMENRM